MYDGSGNLLSGCPSIDRGHGPKGLRIGKVMEIVLAPGTNEFLAKLWGGWEQPSGSMASYITLTVQASLVAAKASNDYPDPRQKSFMPDPTAFMTDENRADVETYATALFGRATHVSLLRGQHHLTTRKFAHIMLASLVMWLDAFISQYGLNHLILRGMLEAGLERTVEGRPVDLTMLKQVS